MALDVIGAGFGRTGTLSLKAALELLGYGPCYHMVEARSNSAHAAMWLAAVRDGVYHWDALFAGYRAAVDWPAAAFWPELARHYPQARVLLSVRDAQDWYRSFSGTILPTLKSPWKPGGGSSIEHRTMTRELVLERTFGGRADDAAHAIGVYEANSARVRADIAAERLLVYEAGSGWGPLSDFLGCPVPDEPYPHTNTTEEFRARFDAQAEPDSSH